MRSTVIPPAPDHYYTVEMQKDGEQSDGSSMPVQRFQLTRMEMILLRDQINRALGPRKDR